MTTRILFGAVLLLAAMPAARADDPKPFAPAFAGDHADVMHVTDDWILWSRSIVIPTGQVAQPRHWHWWIQSVATGETRKFLEYRGRTRLTAVAVQTDGTIVMAHLGTLLWYHPGDPLAGDPRNHKRREQPHPRTVVPGTTKARRFEFIRGYADGVILQPYQTMTNQVTYWVSFKKRALDWKKRVAMTGKAGQYVNNFRAYHRAGNHIAWDKQIFDIEAKRHLGHIPIRVHVRAFHPEYVAGYDTIVRRVDTHLIKRPRGSQVFAIHDGFAYMFAPAGAGQPTRLQALDLKNERVTGLHADDGTDMTSSLFNQRLLNVVRVHQRGKGPMTIFWNRLGIHHWTGTSWRHQPWLKPIAPLDVPKK